jgi:putative DNA primase/helicase
MTIDVDKIRSDYPIKKYLEEKHGRRFKFGKCLCPLHQDDHPSLSVKAGPDGYDRFKCHAASCGKGGDILQLVRELHGCDMPTAAEILTGQKQATSKPEPKAPAKVEPKAPPKRTWETIPERLIPKRRAQVRISAAKADGKVMTREAELLHVYRDAQGNAVLMTARIRTPKGKDVLPIRYVEGELRWKGFTEGELSPLYGLEQLAKHPQLPVLVIEGEKCVDVFQPLVEGKLVVVSWCGGTGGWAKADWEALWGRDATLLPDFDWRPRNQAGEITSEERGGQKNMDGIAQILQTKQLGKLKMVDISEFTEETHKSGYDVVDMLQEGRKIPEIVAWIHAKSKSLQPQASLQQTQPHAQQWLPAKVSLVTNGDGGVKRDDPSNLWLLLKYHPKWKGRFSYDVFDQVPLIDGEPMTGATLSDLRVAITQGKPSLLPKEKDLQNKVLALALTNKVNRFADQLRGLVWDQQPRLAASSLNNGPKGLLVEYANVEDTPLNRVLGMRWMVGLANRLLQDPNSDEGFQHDSILVLEGQQGLRKTSFLRVLGSLFGRPLYTELTGSLGKDKDDMMKLRGKAVVELGEMSAHRRSDQDAFKAFIDRKVDEYRPPYGAEIVRQPRMVVFAGTTNKREYLQDPTGNRRIWPCTVETEIDTRKLERDLEQIWAEAVWLAQNGERNWLDGDELVWHAEVLKGREQIESWDETLEPYFENWPTDGFSTNELFAHLGITLAKDRTKAAEQRLSDLLTKRGYVRRKGSPNSRNQTSRMAWRIYQR